MKKFMQLLIGASLGLSTATAAGAPAAAKPDSSCYDAYGYYGYSAAYCAHDLYGRSGPAERYYGQDRDSTWRQPKDSGRLAEREQDLERDSRVAVRDRSVTMHDNDLDPDRR